MRPPSKSRLLPAVLVIGMVFMPGCQPVIGWVVNTFAPPKKIDAVYKPPAGKTFLVFVDDIVNPVSYEPVKTELAERLNRILEDHDVAAHTVSYDDVLALMASTPDFNRLAVSEVGRKLGADIVLYVKIDKFSLKDSDVSPLWQGKLATTIRLVDVEMGRLWPDDRPEGYPVRPVELPPQTHPSPNYGQVLAKALAARMADRIGKLFYDHKIPAAEARDQQQARDAGMDNLGG